MPSELYRPTLTIEPELEEFLRKFAKYKRRPVATVIVDVLWDFKSIEEKRVEDEARRAEYENSLTSLQSPENKGSPDLVPVFQNLERFRREIQQTAEQLAKVRANQNPDKTQ